MAEAVGGYDFEFIDLPEDLTCILCHYALKSPVQIESCGHTFCEDCFNETKDHAATNYLEFRCPLDRQLIDITRVFKNKADERKVLNLNVKCRYYVDGCDWIGELRDASDHEENCSKNKANRDEPFKIELQQLLNRMTELESKMKSNEQKLLEKDRQIESQNKQIQKQEKQLRDQNKEIKGMKLQVENQSTTIENQRQLMSDQFNVLADIIATLPRMMITDIEGATFSSIGTGFQWKFLPGEVRDSSVILFSPLFYNMDGGCFQLGVKFVKDTYLIGLYRHRGKYDDEIALINKIDCNFRIHVLGKNCTLKLLKFSNYSDTSILKFQKRSQGFFNELRNNDINNLIIDGYIHLHCFFKKFCDNT